MTRQAIILHRIPGARAGAIVDVDERIERHVKAGNAKLLPAGQGDEPEAEQAPTPVLTGASTGSLHDYDELTAPGEKGDEGLEAPYDDRDEDTDGELD